MFYFLGLESDVELNQISGMEFASPKVVTLNDEIVIIIEKQLDYENPPNVISFAVSINSKTVVVELKTININDIPLIVIPWNVTCPIAVSLFYFINKFKVNCTKIQILSKLCCNYLVCLIFHDKY